VADDVTCIYCQSAGPFSDEHVIPAGLGGDDRDWLLKDVVCAVCNTKVFSPLETKVMRSSPLAIARLFYQSRSRDRGGKTVAPTIQAPVSYFDDTGSGLLLEQQLGSGGQSTVHPQVIVVPPNNITVAGSDVATMNALVDELRSLPDTLTICEKFRDGVEVRFDLTPLTWNGRSYVVGVAAGHNKAPADAIWLEPLELPATEIVGILTPRVFRRSKGPMVCRADSLADAAVLLSFVRANHEVLAVPADATATATETPGIHFRQTMDEDAYDRVLTKIGINLCAHLFGAEAVRAPAFDQAREFARTGSGRVRMLPVDQAKQLTDKFPRLPRHHLLVVLIEPASAGQVGHAAVLMQFYGGLMHAVVVAQGSSGLPSTSDLIYVVVDYEANSITRCTPDQFAEYAIRVGAEMPFPF